MVRQSLLLLLGVIFSLSHAARLELHYESLCKQCQIHTAAIDDIVVHGGNEGPVSPLWAALEVSVDYYGHGKNCESFPYSTEHGPDMCVTDRYHLCAQVLGGGSQAGAAVAWWPFTHCLMMNIDQLKCGVNTHCDTTEQFRSMLTPTVALCAAVSHLDLTALAECAEGQQGLDLALESYRRTDKTLVDGFAPAYIDGVKVQGCDDIWLKTPDNLLYGQTVLSALVSSTNTTTTTSSSSSQH